MKFTNVLPQWALHLAPFARRPLAQETCSSEGDNEGTPLAALWPQSYIVPGPFTKIKHNIAIQYCRGCLFHKMLTRRDF